MKKIVISVLLIVIVSLSIYLFSNRVDNKTVSTTGLISNHSSENSTILSEENSTEISQDTFADKEEISTHMSRENGQIQETKESGNQNLDNVSIAFYYAKNIGELIEWIKKADDNDPRMHFLNVARQKKDLLVVEAKDKEYKLETISVHPEHEYMTYTFIKGNNYIDITINLSDSMKQYMSISRKRVSINKAVSKYNRELASTYKNFRLKKGKAKIAESNVNIFYNDGKYYEKLNGELKLIGPSTFFEFNGTEVKMNLYVDLKEKKWNNKYLNLFNFKFIEM